MSRQNYVMETIRHGAEGARGLINNAFSQKEPWQIATITATTVLAGVWLWDFIFQEESLVDRTKKSFFRLARKIPSVSRKIKKEMEKAVVAFEKDIVHLHQGKPYVVQLPHKGWSHEKVVTEVHDYLNLGEYKWKEGYASGAVYNYDPKLIALLTEVYGLASYTNPLHADLFPGVCKMEAEVVRIAANLFHGGPNACGTMTTGGTESILMACKAYRDYAKNEKGIRYPEIVCPVTAHAAFDKAANYFGMRIKHVPVDPVTTKVNMKAMRKAISRNTCMLVGSAPTYPYGIIDPIQEIAALGLKYNIPVHVDGCLGGFITAFMRDAGFPLPPCDFTVKGVTSISADTHKYGFAPKGSSLVLYSDPKYRHQQFFVITDWPGGVYGSPSCNGSRAGGIIAACWATLMHFGYDGYVEATRKIVTVARYIEEGLRKIDGIFVYGKPDTTVIAIGSNDFHIYRLSEALSSKGWNLNPLQFPSGLHICCTYMHTLDGVADKFLEDVRMEVTEIMKTPTAGVDGKMAMYGMSHSIPDRSVVGDFTRFWLDSMYFTKTPLEVSNGIGSDSGSGDHL